MLMIKNVHLLFIAGLFTSSSLLAQNEIDALRFGQLSSGATARSLGLGGSGGSFGADFSSLSINPAGIGVYRSSEIMVTPTLRWNRATGNYLGNEVQDDNTKFNLNNFGLVFTTAAKGAQYEKSNWKAFSVGIGYNRVADFNSRAYYSGLNSSSSITDVFSADALQNNIGQDLVPPYGYLSYYGFLLYDDLTSIAHDQVIGPGGAVEQTRSWRSKGGINEWNLSLGGNYREKLMLGVSANFLSYNFTRNTNFYERDATGNPDNDFDYLSFNEYLTTTGVGFNLKIGAIYVVNEVLRLGAAVHTPTWSAFTDAMDYDLTSNTERLKYRTNQSSTDPVTFVQPDNPYQYDYSLRAPWRGVLSATALMGKYGLVTADYEYVAYNAMRYNFYDQGSQAYEKIVNAAIRDTYTGGHNIRLGIEGRMDNFQARAGFAYYSSPFQQAQTFDGERMDLSLGLGARVAGFFADLAYVHRIQKAAEFAYPIQSPDVPQELARLRYGNNLLALTIGFKF